MMNVNNNPTTNPNKRKRIDKYYWLDKGFEMVDGGLKRAQEQIKSIKAYINGLLGIYVIGSIIDVIYMEIDTLWKLLLVMFPVVLVKWSLYYSEISVLPEFKSFWPDSADSCEITYYQYLNETEGHIKKLKKYSFVSTIALLSILTIVTWWTVETKTKTAKNNDKLTLTQLELKKTKDELNLIKGKGIYDLNTKITDDNHLFLEASLPKNQLIHLQFTRVDEKVLLDKDILIGNSGNFHFDYMPDEFSSLQDSLYVSVKYNLNDKETRKIKKLILLNKK